VEKSVNGIKLLRTKEKNAFVKTGIRRKTDKHHCAV